MFSGYASTEIQISQREHGRAAHQAADQSNQRHLVAMEADGLGRFLHGIGRIAIHAPPAVLARLPRGPHQVARRIEFGQQAVGSFACGHQSPASAAAFGLILAPGSNMRISFMGIMGRKRTNNRNRKVKNPSVPTKVM